MSDTDDTENEELIRQTESLFRRGLESLKAGEYLAAREMFLDIVDMKEDHARALNMLAVMAQQEDDTKDAIDYATRAVESRGDIPQFWRTLALSQRAAGDFDAAIESFEKALSVDPGFEPAHSGLVNTVVRGIESGALEPPNEKKAPASAALKKKHKIAVIFCSVDEEKEKNTRAMFEQLLKGWEHEICVINDPPSLCAGYNEGLEKTDGDLVVFCHDDIEILAEDFAPRLARHLGDYDIVGVAGTRRMAGGNWVRASWPHLAGQVAHVHSGGKGYVLSVYGVTGRVAEDIQAMDGLFIAARRDVAGDLGFDAETFDAFHAYDVDFTFRGHQAGHKLAVVNDLHILHHSGGNFGEEWRQEGMKFIRKHAGKIIKPPEGKPRFASVQVSERDSLLPAMQKLVQVAEDAQSG